MWIYLLSDFHFGLYTFAWKSLCMTQTKGFLSIKLLHQWDSPLSHGLSIPPKPSTSSIWHMKMQPRAVSLQVIDSLITPGEHHALPVPTRARQASAQPRPRLRKTWKNMEKQLMQSSFGLCALSSEHIPPRDIQCFPELSEFHKQRIKGLLSSVLMTFHDISWHLMTLQISALKPS